MIYAYDLIISGVTADVTQVQNTTCVTCHLHEEDLIQVEPEVIVESFNSRKVFYDGDFVDDHVADREKESLSDWLAPLAIVGGALTAVLGLGAILVICQLKRKIDEDQVNQ